MESPEVRNIIQSTFLKEYTGLFPIDLDNQKSYIPTGKEEWVRLSIKYNPDKTTTTLGCKGNRKYTKAGTATIQVFTPAETATDRNDEMAQMFLDLYEGVSFRSLRFIECGIKTIGTEGKWYNQNVVLPFRYEHVK